VAGRNYGQGSSREHAAVAPRDLGLRIVLAKGFARIHRQNLINYGVLPLVFVHPEDYDRLAKGDVLSVRNLHRAIRSGQDFTLECNGPIVVRHNLTAKQADLILAGGLINCYRNERTA
jgi:aconitate hydratase